MDKDLKIQELEDALVLLVKQEYPAWFQDVTDRFGDEMRRYEKKVLDIRIKLRNSLDDYQRCRAENASLQATNAALFDSVSMLIKSEQALTNEHTRLLAREEELGQGISAKNETIHSLELKCEENAELRVRLEEAEEKLAVLEPDRDRSELSSQDREHQTEVNYPVYGQHSDSRPIPTCQPPSAKDEGNRSRDGMEEGTSSLPVDSVGVEGFRNLCKVLTAENTLLRHQAMTLASDKSRAVARILQLDSLLRGQSAYIQETIATSESAKIALADALDRLKDLNRKLHNKVREITELHFDLGEQDRRSRNASDIIASLRHDLRNREQEALLERSILLDQISRLKAELQQTHTESSSRSTLSSGDEGPGDTRKTVRTWTLR